MQDELTRREKEVVLELLDGGRVASIAELFGVSPRTVSNHLKAAFVKLGVHSQAELIELARAAPDRLGLEASLSARSQLEQADLEHRCDAAVERLITRVEAAYVGPAALSQLRGAVRAALPLDSERRRDLRDWLELKTRVDAVGGPGATSQRLIDEWRGASARRISRMQAERVIRDDLEPADILRSIGALTLGAGTRLLGNASAKSLEDELRMIDGYIDTLAALGAPADEHGRTRSNRGA